MNKQKETAHLPKFSGVPVKIAAIYAIMGGVWIIFSDRFLALLITDRTLFTLLETGKGWFYVAVTAFILYWLIKRYLAEIFRATKAQGASEARFQAILQSAPVSILEVDVSAVKADLDNLAEHGVNKISQYFVERPDFVRQALQKLKLLDVNEAALRLCGAPSKTELLEGLAQLFEPGSLPIFREALIAIAEGKSRFEAEAALQTLHGERKNIWLALAIPADRARFSSLSITVMDITERKRTEELLRLLESAVQQTSEAITITTAELDPPGPRIVYVNPAFTRITGYTAEEVLGKTPRILQGPKTDRAELERMLQRLMHRQTFQGETVNYRKDGTEFVMEWYVAPLMDSTFQITHFVALQRDVTKRNRAEKERRENEALLQVIFDQAFQLMGLMKPDGTLIKINRTAFDFIKGKEAEVLGKPFWETPWWTHSAEQQERLREAIKTAALGKFTRFEATHPTPDGGLVYVDFSLKPVKDEQGQVVLLVPEGRDITARKLAEEGVHKLNKELRRKVVELEAATGRLKELDQR